MEVWEVHTKVGAADENITGIPGLVVLQYGRVDYLDVFLQMPIICQ
jgi:hypothetical protein